MRISSINYSRRAKPWQAKEACAVQHYLNGELHFRYGQQELRYTLLPARPQPLSKTKKTRQRREGVKPYVPPREHPWQRFQFGKGAPWLPATPEGFSK